MANENLKLQKYLKKTDSVPSFSKIEDGGVEVKVVTPIFYARILLIFVPSTFVESLRKTCQFPKVAIPLKQSFILLGCTSLIENSLAILPSNLLQLQMKISMLYLPFAYVYYLLQHAMWLS